MGPEEYSGFVGPGGHDHPLLLGIHRNVDERRTALGTYRIGKRRKELKRAPQVARDPVHIGRKRRLRVTTTGQVDMVGAYRETQTGSHRRCHHLMAASERSHAMELRPHEEKDHPVVTNHKLIPAC